MAAPESKGRWKPGESDNKIAYITPKREAFAIAVASGQNLSDAYRKAGYSCGTLKTVNEAASRLLKDSKITARVAELRKPIAEQAQLTLQRHLEDLRVLRDDAVKISQFGAAIAAEVARGKAAGLYVTKTEISGNMGVRALSDAQLDAKISGLLRVVHG